MDGTEPLSENGYADGKPVPASRKRRPNTANVRVLPADSERDREVLRVGRATLLARTTRHGDLLPDFIAPDVVIAEFDVELRGLAAERQASADVDAEVVLRSVDEDVVNRHRRRIAPVPIRVADRGVPDGG